jgi:hypothetical protein
MKGLYTAKAKRIWNVEDRVGSRILREDGSRMGGQWSGLAEMLTFAAKSL